MSAESEEPPAKSWYLPDRVVREIKDCGMAVREAAKLQDVMDREATGRLLPNDCKKIDDVVHELRIKGHKRIFRLYFARLEGTLVLLALHFKNKKVDNDVAGKELARRRFDELEEEGREQAS